MANGWGWCVLVLAVCGLASGQGTEKRRTSSVCSSDADCPDNAFCKGSAYCVCQDGFVYATINATHKGCLTEAKSGEPCTQALQCQSTLGIHAECVNDICTCKANAHLQADRCFETAIVGERCMVDENCYLGDRSDPERMAYCVRGYCSCELAHSPRDGGIRCVKDAGLNEECEDEQQCAGAGLMCRDKACSCKSGWVTHEYTKSCLQAVETLGSACDYDEQCSVLAGSRDAPNPGAALCLGGMCACAHTARSAGTPARCWHRHRPGEDCRRDEECVSEEEDPGYCLNGHCTCKTCSPSPADFDGAASLPQSPLLLAAVMVAAAILRH